MFAEKPQHAQFRPYSKPSAVRVPAFIAEAPALFAGAVVSLGVMGAIFVNAMWFQTGQHPAPIFTPRTHEVAVRPVVTQPVQTAAIVPAREQPAQNPQAEAASSSRELLRQIQTALKSRNYYTGKLDGLYGSRTKAAIEAFERDHALQTTGTPSFKLLSAVYEAAPPAPQLQVASAAKPVTEPETVKTPEQVADGMIARIQAGLRQYGYDEVVVDGRMGQQTATAIQRFQLAYGMKITGEPSQALLQKLSDSGA